MSCDWHNVLGLIFFLGLKVFSMTLNNKDEKNYCGKCLLLATTLTKYALFKSKYDQDQDSV